MNLSRAQPMYRHTDIYIGRYDVADVSYRQNSADIYQQYLLIKVLRCCSAWRNSETQVATSSLTLLD